MKRVVALAIFAGVAMSAAAVNRLHAQETARSAYETPIWKPITLGTYRDANVLREALNSAHCSIEKVTRVAGPPASPIYDDGPGSPFCNLEALANEIIGRPAFALSRTRTDVDLVILSVSELGLGKQGASLKDIYARAKSLGFALCPAEVGPQLRLKLLSVNLSRICSFLRYTFTCDKRGLRIILKAGNSRVISVAHSQGRFRAENIVTTKLHYLTHVVLTPVGQEIPSTL